MAYHKALIEGEVFLAHIEEKPAFFARIENIESDIKKGWWRVTFVILTIPLTTTTWIIDDDQIRGTDFTMGGIPVRLERVVAPEHQLSAKNAIEQDTAGENGDVQSGAKILSFNDKR